MARHSGAARGARAYSSSRAEASVYRVDRAGAVARSWILHVARARATAGHASLMRTGGWCSSVAAFVLASRSRRDRQSSMRMRIQTYIAKRTMAEPNMANFAHSKLANSGMRWKNLALGVGPQQHSVSFLGGGGGGGCRGGGAR